jgi:hypothetical protein
MTVFWDAVPCSMLEMYRRFRRSLLTAFIIRAQGDDRRDDGGNKYPWNVG